MDCNCKKVIPFWGCVADREPGRWTSERSTTTATIIAKNTWLRVSLFCQVTEIRGQQDYCIQLFLLLRAIADSNSSSRKSFSAHAVTLRFCLVQGDCLSITLQSKRNTCTLEHNTQDFNLFTPDWQTGFTDRAVNYWPTVSITAQICDSWLSMTPNTFKKTVFL